MSKIILEFDGIEEQYEARAAMDGVKWKLAMWDLDQWLRSQTKHAPDEMSQDTYDTFEKCRETLQEILNNSNLTLE